MNPSPKRSFEQKVHMKDGRKRIRPTLCSNRVTEELFHQTEWVNPCTDPAKPMNNQNSNKNEEEGENSFSGRRESILSQIESERSKEISEHVKDAIGDLRGMRNPVDSILKEYIASCFEVFSKRMESKLENVQTELCIIKNDVSETKDLCHSILMSGNNYRHQKVVSGRGSTTKKSDYELVNFNACFNSSVLSKVLRGVLTKFITENAVKYKINEASSDTSTSILRSYSDTVSSVVFGKKANQGKSVWKEGVGLGASKLRKTIVLSALINVQRNRFNQFRIDDDDEESVSSALSSCATAEDKHKGIEGVKKIRKPEWLVNMSVEHVENVRKSKENKKHSQARILSGMKNDAESSSGVECLEYVATEKLFSEITILLHDSRSKGKSMLFEEVGYFLTNWHIPRTYSSGSLSNPFLNWINPEVIHKIEAMHKIPLCKTGQDVLEIRANETAYKEFSKKCDGLLLSVKHGVQISNNDTESNQYNENQYCNDRNGTAGVHDSDIGFTDKFEKKIHRVVNLLDVALNFVCAYCGFSVKKRLGERLALSDTTLKASYAIAIVLKEMVNKYMAKIEEMDNSKIDEDKWAEEVRFESISLADLKPSPSSQNKSFVKMVTCMSLETYNAHNVEQSEEHNLAVNDEYVNDGEAEKDDDGNLSFVLL